MASAHSPSVPQVFAAVDCGASSSRVIAVCHQDKSLEVREMHRFPTPFYERGGELHWDLGVLKNEIIKGLAATFAAYGEAVKAIGVDTWGVDYVLLDADGKAMDDAYQYRDNRTAKIREWMDAQVPAYERFRRTGIQNQFFNTANQLCACVQCKAQVKAASQLLYMPDWISYVLCGVARNELTEASTSQLLGADRRYDTELLKIYGIPESVFAPLVEPGTILGNLTPEIQALVGGNCPVVAVASHDTGSAYVAAPCMDAETAFLSSGTWSLFGLELTTLELSEKAYACGLTNEAGPEGTNRLLRNIVGLWMIQECCRAWQAQGEKIDFAELDRASAAEPAWRILLNPDHGPFLLPGDMPGKIEAFCRQTGQPVPASKGAMIRAIQDTLALTYRRTLVALQDLTGRTFTRINIVGGGAQSAVLNQLTANATGCDVLAGPIEATALGNVIMQMKALGLVANLAEGRALIRSSVPLEHFSPRTQPDFDSVLARFAQVCQA